MSYIKAFAFAILLLVIFGWLNQKLIRRVIPEAAQEHAPDYSLLTLDHAKDLFKEHLSRSFGDHFRVLAWEQAALLDSTFRSPNTQSVSVGYELECLSPVDITSLNRVVPGGHTLTGLTADSVMYIDNFVRTGSGYRIENLERPKQERTLCTRGQKIFFYGMLEFDWRGSDWVFNRQEAQPFDSFYAGFMAKTDTSSKTTGKNK